MAAACYHLTEVQVSSGAFSWLASCLPLIRSACPHVMDTFSSCSPRCCSSLSRYSTRLLPFLASSLSFASFLWASCSWWVRVWHSAWGRHCHVTVGSLNRTSAFYYYHYYYVIYSHPQVVLRTVLLRPLQLWVLVHEALRPLQRQLEPLLFSLEALKVNLTKRWTHTHLTTGTTFWLREQTCSITTFFLH